MARRKKNMTLEETIESVRQYIEKTENNLKSAKAELKDLLKQQEEMELQELYSIIKESGKTLPEIKELLLPEETTEE